MTGKRVTREQFEAQVVPHGCASGEQFTEGNVSKEDWIKLFNLLDTNHDDIVEEKDWDDELGTGAFRCLGATDDADENYRYLVQMYIMAVERKQETGKKKRRASLDEKRAIRRSNSASNAGSRRPSLVPSPDGTLVLSPGKSARQEAIEEAEFRRLRRRSTIGASPEREVMHVDGQAFEAHRAHGLCVTAPDVPLTEGCIALNAVWESDAHVKAVDTLIPLMLEGNPDLLEEKLREGLSFNADGHLKSWNMRALHIQVLPEEFGTVRATRDIILYDNSLKTLPESFGAIKVGGELGLLANSLRCVPNSFGAIVVGGDLNLGYNSMRPTSFPESFAAITVGKDLWMKGNHLTQELITSLVNVRGKVSTDATQVDGETFETLIDGEQCLSLMDSPTTSPVKAKNL